MISNLDLNEVIHTLSYSHTFFGKVRFFNSEVYLNFIKSLGMNQLSWVKSTYGVTFNKGMIQSIEESFYTKDYDYKLSIKDSKIMVNDTYEFIDWNSHLVRNTYVKLCDMFKINTEVKTSEKVYENNDITIECESFRAFNEILNFHKINLGKHLFTVKNIEISEDKGVIEKLYSQEYTLILTYVWQLYKKEIKLLDSKTNKPIIILNMDDALELFKAWNDIKERIFDK